MKVLYNVFREGFMEDFSKEFLKGRFSWSWSRKVEKTKRDFIKEGGRRGLEFVEEIVGKAVIWRI